MRLLRVFLLCVAALSLAAAGRADESKKSDPPGKESKPDPVNLLVGKWKGVGKFTGVTLEFARDGTYVSTVIFAPAGRRSVMPGTWKRQGDKLFQTLGRIKTTVTITRLTEKEFRFTNNAGQEATYERAEKK